MIIYKIWTKILCKTVVEWPKLLEYVLSFFRGETLGH